MFNPERGAAPLRIGIALAACLSLLGAAPPAGACLTCAVTEQNTGDGGSGVTTADGQGPIVPCSSPPTVEQCMIAWRESLAPVTCRRPEVHVDGNDCSISAMCSTNTTSAYISLASITECVDYIPDLSNCDGDFRIGNC